MNCQIMGNFANGVLLNERKISNYVLRFKGVGDYLIVGLCKILRNECVRNIQVFEIQKTRISVLIITKK